MKRPLDVTAAELSITVIESGGMDQSKRISPIPYSSRNQYDSNHLRPDSAERGYFSTQESKPGNGNSGNDKKGVSAQSGYETTAQLEQSTMVQTAVNTTQVSRMHKLSEQLSQSNYLSCNSGGCGSGSARGLSLEK